MRTLIYVPIIHTRADLGSIGNSVAQRTKAGLGEKLWREHQKTVEGFWAAMEELFDHMEVSGYKIYQDGMVADGEVGEKIVKECLKLGSKNYGIISKLLKKGAILVKTEDFHLAKKERDSLLRITQGAQGRRTSEKLLDLMKYKFNKNLLLRKRDKFIARRIDETLLQGETGILFIGAFHNVKEKLPDDIQVKEIKDINKVKEYQKLLPFHSKRQKRFEELGKYLVSKIVA